MVRLYGAGDYEGAADAYSKVLRVFTLLSSRVSAKALLRALGFPGGDPRLPRMLLTTEDDTTAGLRKLAEIGIPELEGLLPYKTKIVFGLLFSFLFSFLPST